MILVASEGGFGQSSLATDRHASSEEMASKLVASARPIGSASRQTCHWLVERRRSKGANLLCQFRSYALNYNLVVTCLILPEETHCRIPRTVVSIEQPSVVGRVGQKYPSRPTKGRSEVSYAGINGDDQIQAGNQRRGSAEIRHVTGVIGDVRSLSKDSYVAWPRILLKAYELGIASNQSSHHVKRN